MTPTWLVLAALVPFPVFVAVYAFAPWWRNPAGRSVMLLAVTCTAALMLPVYREVAGVRLPEWVRLALFLLIAAAGWTQLVTLLVVQRRGARQRRGLVDR